MTEHPRTNMPESNQIELDDEDAAVSVVDDSQCPMCGGVGGWPGLFPGQTQRVKCKPCDGTGLDTGVGETRQ